MLNRPILCAVLAVPLLFLLAGCDGGGESASTTRSPNAAKLLGVFVADSSDFAFRNDNNFPWTNVNITLNHSIGSWHEDGWSAHASKVMPNAMVEFSLSSFTKDDGTRFDPDAIEPQSATIDCDTPEGRVWSETFDIIRSPQGRQ